MLALHHNGQRTKTREIADLRIIENGGIGAHGHTTAHLNASHFHHPIFVKMRLQGAAAIQCDKIANAHADQ